MKTNKGNEKLKLDIPNVCLSFFLFYNTHVIQFVFLDNIVDGKRRRTPLVKDPGTPKSASKRQKTASTKVDEETKPQPTRSSRRGCKRQHAETVAPKATSTPTPKGKAPRKKPRGQISLRSFLYIHRRGGNFLLNASLDQ